VKTRLDKLLVDRGITASRERAQALILAGKVLVNEQKIEKAGASVEPDATLRLLGEDLRYVSRGGVKLEKALDHWRIDLTGKVCLDIGASTGGFSDCMLQRGAAQVIAVDTGYGQMDFRLRNDPRIRLLEKTNARYLTRNDVGEPVDFIAMDVAFISATLVLPAVIGAAFVERVSSRAAQEAAERVDVAASGAKAPDKEKGLIGALKRCATQDPTLATAARHVVVLVKPQFEVGRKLVGKGGIVRDEAAQQSAVTKVEASLHSLNCERVDSIESPILGAEGNREFLMYAEFPESGHRIIGPSGHRKHTGTAGLKSPDDPITR